jgi:hypothetical protein
MAPKRVEYNDLKNASLGIFEAAGVAGSCAVAWTERPIKEGDLIDELI